MRILNLMEDTKGEQPCIYQHGLSFYIETEHHKLLMDTGANGDFIQNAKTLGVDLTAVDIVIISHGHYDHTGGLLEFCKLNSKATIYMHALAGRGYYHVNDKEERYIGINPDILKLENLVLVDKDRKIDEELFLFTGVTGRTLWPKGNLELKVKTEDGDYVQDEFLHEQYLVIRENVTDIHIEPAIDNTQGKASEMNCNADTKKTLLCSGCAHNGILNIMEHYCNLFGEAPDVVMSGFHMMQKTYSGEDREAIRNTGQKLRDYSTLFYTGHCTGMVAYELLKEEMGGKVTAVHSGDEVIL